MEREKQEGERGQGKGQRRERKWNGEWKEGKNGRGGKKKRRGDRRKGGGRPNREEE